MDNTIKISCEKLEQEVSMKREDDKYIVKLTTIKNNLVPEQTGVEICWSYNDYSNSIEKYLSLANEQASLIAVLSL
jgi:hypothetical protein